MFGSRAEIMRGLTRALAPPGSAAPVRAAYVVRRLPAVVGTRARHLAAICEVGEMLTERLGLPAPVQSLFAGFTERWDGKGGPRGAKGEAYLAGHSAGVADLAGAAARRSACRLACSPPRTRTTR
jgi:hypothetical protein